MGRGDPQISSRSSVAIFNVFRAPRAASPALAPGTPGEDAVLPVVIDYDPGIFSMMDRRRYADRARDQSCSVTIQW